jgi:hypothetical protein
LSLSVCSYRSRDADFAPGRTCRTWHTCSGCGDNNKPILLGRPDKTRDNAESCGHWRCVPRRAEEGPRTVITAASSSAATTTTSSKPSYKTHSTTALDLADQVLSTIRTTQNDVDVTESSTVTVRVSKTPRQTSVLVVSTTSTPSPFANHHPDDDLLTIYDGDMDLSTTGWSWEWVLCAVVVVLGGGGSGIIITKTLIRRGQQVRDDPSRLTRYYNTIRIRWVASRGEGRSRTEAARHLAQLFLLHLRQQGQPDQHPSTTMTEMKEAATLRDLEEAHDNGYQEGRVDQLAEQQQAELRRRAEEQQVERRNRLRYLQRRDREEGVDGFVLDRPRFAGEHVFVDLLSFS